MAGTRRAVGNEASDRQKMDFRYLRIEIEDRIALLTFDRPQALNALNTETLDELQQALGALERTNDVGCLILTGSGEKSFVAGADINQLSRQDPESARRLALKGQSVFGRLSSFPGPVIAAVNGFCLGGGCEMALACHIRVASKNARFGQPEVKLGLIPGYGGTQRLTRLVGQGRALELILSGEMIDADEALRIGLVNKVVEAKDLLEDCRALARTILANSPSAVRYALEAVRRGSEMPLQEALGWEAGLFGLCFASQDAREGTRAFLEKRAPEFKDQ